MYKRQHQDIGLPAAAPVQMREVQDDQIDDERDVAALLRS
jgi:hypothetical protein